MSHPNSDSESAVVIAPFTEESRAPASTALLTIDVRRISLVLLIVAGGLFVVHLITRVVHWTVGGVPAPIAIFLERFDMDSETTVPTWFSAILLLLIAGAALLIAIMSKQLVLPRAPWWCATAIIFVLLSLDEASAVHEITVVPLQRLFGITSGPLLFAWVIPAGIAVVIVAALFARFFLSLPTDTRKDSAIGAGVWLFGVLGMEMISAALVYTLAVPGSGSSLSLDVLAGIEETIEMVGAILILRALLLHLRRHVLPRRQFQVRIS